MKENVRNRCWLVLLMLLMGCAQEREPEDTASPSSEQPLTYATYTNDRFDFSVAYPADLLRPQGEPTNNDGQLPLAR